MEQLVESLVRYENEVLFITLIAAIFVSAFFEALRPRRDQSRSQLVRRWPTNLGLLVIGQLNLSWVVPVSALLVSTWSGDEAFGLAPMLGLGFFTSTVLALLVFEFLTYWFHRWLHTNPLLWRIHAIHHCDTEVDFSTTFRNHPLELLVIAPITIPVVFLLGFPPAAVVAYQLVKTAILLFAHSNVRIPERVDRVLRLFVATPDYHRVHHSMEQAYTDSNFSTVLPVYDYLFGTCRSRPASELESMPIGLDYLREPADSRIDRLLLAPFLWKRAVSRRAATVPEPVTP